MRKVNVATSFTLLTLLLGGCSPMDVTVQNVEVIETNIDKIKGFKPVAIEVEGELSLTDRGEPTQARINIAKEITVGVVNDVYQDYNAELIASISDTVTETYDSVKINVETPETSAVSSYLTSVNQLIAKGSQIVIIPNQRAQEAMETIISNYPEVSFVTVDHFIKASNVIGIKYRDESIAFLAGVVAASQSKTNEIAFVSLENAQVNKESIFAGYQMGAQSINPDIEVHQLDLKDDSSSQQVYDVASSLYSNGIDVVYESIGSRQLEVVQAAKDFTNANKEVWVINSNCDLYNQGLTETNHSVVLTSTVKQTESAMNQVVSALIEGEVSTGNQIILGLDNYGVSLVLENPMLSDEIIKTISHFQQKLIDGEIMIPTNKDLILAQK
ncbi:MAG: BMP family lipoprotein [Turicibacter sp.]